MNEAGNEPDRRDRSAPSTARSWESELVMRQLDDVTTDVETNRALVVSLRRRVELLERVLVVVAVVAVVALVASLA